MLRSFRLANHRSFLDEQELLLIPSVPDPDRDVLTVAAVYGANASGKSNLLDGLMFMSNAVALSFRRWSAEEGILRKPFRLDPEGRKRPSTFVVELVIDGVPHTYGFTVDDDVVKEEWLYTYPEKRRRVLFEREGPEIRFGAAAGLSKSKLEVLEELTRPNALFLSLAAQSNLTSLTPVYRWFEENLRFRRNSGSRIPRVLEARRIARYLRRDPTGGRRLLELITAADMGVTRLFIEETEDPAVLRRIKTLSAQRTTITDPGQDSAEDLEREIRILQRQSMVPELRLVHAGSEEPFSVDDESDGTRNWIALLPLVLDSLERGDTLVIDEIDSSLHPLLTVRLLHMFASIETNPKHAQLIFTTHDTTPLGSYVGRDVLRRDQIWFVEKDTVGQSRLYPLTDFKPRVGENAEKRYLGGSYGAVPVLDDIEFESLGPA